MLYNCYNLYNIVIFHSEYAKSDVKHMRYHKLFVMLLRYKSVYTEKENFFKAIDGSDQFM